MLGEFSTGRQFITEFQLDFSVCGVISSGVLPSSCGGQPRSVFKERQHLFLLFLQLSSPVVKHSTYQASVEMDKEERKTINKGQEDEMVTIFHNFLRRKKIK